MTEATKETKLSNFDDLSFLKYYQELQDNEFYQSLQFSNLGQIVAQMEYKLVMKRKLKLVNYFNMNKTLYNDQNGQHIDHQNGVQSGQNGRQIDRQNGLQNDQEGHENSLQVDHVDHINYYHLKNVLIDQIPVPSPVFIYGIGRSGTTYLHRLLALDTTRRARAPLLWELANPVPETLDPSRLVDDRMTRKEFMKNVISKREVCKEFMMLIYEYLKLSNDVI